MTTEQLNELEQKRTDLNICVKPLMQDCRCLLASWSAMLVVELIGVQWSMNHNHYQFALLCSSSFGVSFAYWSWCLNDLRKWAKMLNLLNEAVDIVAERK